MEGRVQQLTSINFKFQILLLTFKALNGMTPACISDLINARKHARYSLRSLIQALFFYIQQGKRKNPLVSDLLV